MLGAVTCGMDYKFTDSKDWLNFIFYVSMFLLFSLCWRRYYDVIKIKKYDKLKLVLLAKIFCVLAIISTIASAYIAYKIIRGPAAIGDIRYGGNIEGFYSSIGISMLTVHIIWIIGATSRFLIPIGFILLTTENGKLATMCLLCSIAYPMYGMTSATRLDAISYLIMLLANFILFRKIIPKKVFSKLVKISSIVAIFFIILLGSITNQRFSDRSEFSLPISQKLVDKSPTLASIVLYSSQHYSNAFHVMRDYQGEKGYGVINVLPFISYVGSFCGLEFENQQEYIDKTCGFYAPFFFGLTPNFLIDFGYFFSLLFAVFFFLIVYRSKFKKEGVYSVANLLSFQILFMIPSFGIFSTVLALFQFHIAILVLIIMIIYLR